MELGVDRVGLTLLRDLITDRAGMYYDSEREDSLAERLASFAIDRGFRSYLDLFYLLKYEDNPADWWRVMDALSVPETYFWREVDQIRAVVDRIIPELVRHLRGGPLRIWSIPCASGEEPLTIAMLLEEAGWFGRLPIEVHASDASPSAVSRARVALYRERAFRTLPQPMKEKYFDQLDGGWRPIPSLQSRITSWSVVNLLDPCQVAPFVCAPVIFCRNAFIYFAPGSHTESDRGVRAGDALAGVPVRGRIRVPAEHHHRVHPPRG